MKPAASQPASRVRRPPFGDHPFALGVASGDPQSVSGLGSASGGPTLPPEHWLPAQPTVFTLLLWPL